MNTDTFDTGTDATTTFGGGVAAWHVDRFVRHVLAHPDTHDTHDASIPYRMPKRWFEGVGFLANTARYVNQLRQQTLVYHQQLLVVVDIQDDVLIQTYINDNAGKDDTPYTVPTKFDNLTIKESKEQLRTYLLPDDYMAPDTDGFMVLLSLRVYLVMPYRLEML
jgi:hypothetical protein